MTRGGRTSIKGTHAPARKHSRRAYTFAEKHAIIQHFESTHDMQLTITKFFPHLTALGRESKRKQIYQWLRNKSEIAAAVSNVKTAHHGRLRAQGIGMVLKEPEQLAIVDWINSLRADGVPVSSTMHRLKALEVSDEAGVPAGSFVASATWQQTFLSHHRLSFRCRSRASQSSPDEDGVEAQRFAEKVKSRMEEIGTTRVYNADQTAVFFEMIPKKTVDARGSRTVWVKCGKKEKERASAMLLGDSDGNKYSPFLVFKCRESTLPDVKQENDEKRHGFGKMLWSQVKNVQERYGVQMYANKAGWWNSTLTIAWLDFHFGDRTPFSDPVLLLLDAFSGHWTQDVKDYAATVNVILMAIPPN